MGSMTNSSINKTIVSKFCNKKSVVPISNMSTQTSIYIYLDVERL